MLPIEPTYTRECDLQTQTGGTPAWSRDLSLNTDALLVYFEGRIDTIELGQPDEAAPVVITQRFRKDSANRRLSQPHPLGRGPREDKAERLHRFAPYRSCPDH